jgi:colanic acid/amylovoran biosynthesis glycosyltransferase
VKPVALHSVNPYLFRTGSWVYGQIANLTRWKPVVVATKRENMDEFPLDDVHAWVDLPAPRRWWERALKSLNGGHFPFMARVARASGARLLHSHFAGKGWKDLPLARATRLPHATSFYGADIWASSRQPKWRARFGELFERGDLFLVEGHAMRKKVESLGCPADKIVVQHLGVDLAAVAFTERRAPADGLVRVLICGRATAKKGHELGLRAFARAQRSAPHLRLSAMLLAGDDEQRREVARLTALVRELGLEGVVDFPPPLPYSAWRKSLERYHVFFAPSLHAPDGDAEGGAPVALIDMSAQGIPVVASDHCDLPEVVPHDVGGLVFREGDEQAAAAALLEAAARPQDWPRWGRDGRAHVEREYDARKQAAELERIYDRLAARGPR